MNAIVSSGGEGVVLRKPLSSYLPGRSPFLVKIKVQKKEEDEGEEKKQRQARNGIDIRLGSARRQRRNSAESSRGQIHHFETVCTHILISVLL